MARIRSIHPGLWTDDAFVSLSLPARLFLIGLWNEADDYGVFAWKPTTLKMRLAPADAVDAAALLDELVENEFIAKVVRPPKVWGVVRNFRVFQRPKNPSAPVVEIDAEIASLVGLDHPSHRQELPKRGGSTTPDLPQPGSILGADRSLARNNNDLPAQSYPRPTEDIPHEGGSTTPDLRETYGSPTEKTGQMERRGEEGRGEEDSDAQDPTTARATSANDLPFDPPDRSADQDRFPEFWAAYPRKEGQTNAEAEFVVAAIDVDAETIISGAKAFAAAAARSRQELRFLPMPARWLAEKRWTDVHQTPASDTIDDRLAAWGIGPAKPVAPDAIGMAPSAPEPETSTVEDDECPFLDDPFQTRGEDDHAQPVRSGARARDRDAAASAGAADLSGVQPSPEGAEPEGPMPLRHADSRRDRGALPPLRPLRGGAI